MAARSYRRLAFAAAVLAVAAASVWYGFFPDAPPTDPGGDVITLEPPPPDPRLTFDTPYRNVKPDVKYVGDAACADCHVEIDKTYHQHPMGRSAAWTTQAKPIEKFDPTHNPATAQGFDLKVVRGQDEVRHIMTWKGEPALQQYERVAAIAIGSGARGRSYLIVEDNGAVWQSPVSWFSHETKWDASPGFRLPESTRRTITAECLFCHVDRVEPVPHSLNRYREPLLVGQANVGCERCHGPGELHVTERSAGHIPAGLDTSIVNPKHLPQDLRMAICQQCHLQGEERVVRRGRDLYEFRPGLPLEQFVATFVRHPDLIDYHKSVGQFEQMTASKCFTASAGRMDCASCHDPHAVPAAEAAAAFYRGKCLTCHQSKGCSLPEPDRRAKADSCIACHMPRASSSNIAHTAVTDHRVLRTPQPAKAAGRLDPESPPLVAFAAGPHAPPLAERERDLGVALAQLARKLPPSARSTAALVGMHAERRLDAALAAWPGDFEAWRARAMLAISRRDDAAVRAAATKAAALVPDSELALDLLAEAAVVDDPESTIRTVDRLIELNPSVVAYRTTRAQAHIQRYDWAAAAADCRAALAIYPFSPDARALLAICLYKLGDPAGGRRELDTAVGLASDQWMKERFRSGYERATR